MIDCENEVYTRIVNDLKDKYTGNVNISGVYVPNPSEFPHVSAVMEDSTTASEYQDSSLRENVASMMFQIDIYSNDKQKKTVCKEILKVIDETMEGMNFTRTSYSPIPNRADNSIYRITARYRGCCDGDYFYRR